MQMELTDIELKNLMIFLSRTQVSGNEAPALVDIGRKLEAMLKERTEAVTPKETNG